MHTFRWNSKRSYCCSRCASFAPVRFVYRMCSFSDSCTGILENFLHRNGYRFSVQFSNCSPIFHPFLGFSMCVRENDSHQMRTRSCKRDDRIRPEIDNPTRYIVAFVLYGPKNFLSLGHRISHRSWLFHFLVKIRHSKTFYAVPKKKNCFCPTRKCFFAFVGSTLRTVWPTLIENAHFLQDLLQSFKSYFPDNTRNAFLCGWTNQQLKYYH